MGLFPRHPRHRASSYPILAADMDDVEVAGGAESEYPDDVYTDAGKFCVGGQSGGEVGVEWMEYVGDISRDGGFAGMFAGHGDYL